MGLDLLIAWSALAATAVLGSGRIGRSYGLAFASFCSVLWGLIVWGRGADGVNPWQFGLLAAGGAAILGLGIGAGRLAWLTRRSDEPACSPTANVSYDASLRSGRLVLLSELPAQFGIWLDRYRDHVDPWPAFEYHVRTVLGEICAGKDVRAYRVLDESGLMVPLGQSGPHEMKDCVAAGQGVAAWVIDRGQPYYAFVKDQPDEVQGYVQRTPQPLSWCFPIRQGLNVAGLVTVGTLDMVARRDVPLLVLVAGLINEQWICVTEICRTRATSVTDPISGLMNRTQFLRQAPLLIEKSRRQAKNVTAAAFSIEGLDRLDDQGYWGLRDLAISSVGQVLRRRLASDMCASRLDDSRFVMLWSGDDSRRADQDVSEIISDLEAMFLDRSKWRQEIKVRCGLAQGRSEREDLQNLISTSLAKMAPDGELQSLGATS